MATLRSVKGARLSNQNGGGPDFDPVGLPPPPDFDKATFIPTMPLTEPPHCVTEPMTPSMRKLVHERAQYEFVNQGFDKSVCGVDLPELVKYYGFGYFVYFDLLLVSMYFVVALFFLQLVPFAWYAHEVRPAFESTETSAAGTGSNSTFHLSGYGDLFITNYTSRQAGAWYAMNIIMVVLAVLWPFAVLYRIRKKRAGFINDKLMVGCELEQRDADRIIRYKQVESRGKKLTVEDPVEQWSNLSFFLRYLAAASAFCGLVGFTAVFSYYGTRKYEDDPIISVLIAILVQVLNSAYFGVGYLTTMAMPIRTWTAFQKAYAAKLVLFRVCLQIAVFTFKSYRGSCAYYVIGEQFFFMLLTDLILGNLLEITGPVVVSQLKKFIHTHTSFFLGITKAELDPQFEISVEYLELFGRNYVMYMASVIFPLATVLSFVGLLIDYWLDKWRLMKISAVQRSRLDGEQRMFVSGMLWLSIICAFFTPWAGILFILSGLTSDKCTECAECRFP
eukprot:Rhum_TRINITY_DN24852_c0_g1::Rhum_TRINITY_DN24852_c0_g1_i1::g.180286::m.180286